MTTRFGTIILAFLLIAAEEKIKPRYGVEANDSYKQSTPAETLRSVLAAIEAKRVDYVLAHLADPAFVDERVKQTGGRFDVMVKETTQKLEADPESLRELRKFLADGEWKEEGANASASCKDVKGKQVYFKKIGERWFFMNRVKPVKDEQP
jgi:hypothetical protein